MEDKVTVSPPKGPKINVFLNIYFFNFEHYCLYSKRKRSADSLLQHMTHQLMENVDLNVAFKLICRTLLGEPDFKKMTFSAQS